MDTSHETGGANPWGLVSGAEGLITGTVVCAAAIAYASGNVDSVAERSLARSSAPSSSTGWHICTP